MYLVILYGILIFVILIIVIWVAYLTSVTYQQTLSITIPFNETYRYVPKMSSSPSQLASIINLNKDHKYKIDSIKITITGSIKRDSLKGSTITPASQIKDVIHENIINPYKNCLLIQEANTFIVEENILKRCPMTKNPTVENLCILFFNKLAPLMPKLGAQLISIRIISEGVKASQSRHTWYKYTM